MKDMKDRVITIEDAKIIWRNFSGKISRYNAQGFRTFNVVIPKDLAYVLIEDGWNVKWLRPKDQDFPEEKDGTIEVKVQFVNRPPKIIVMSGKLKNKTQLTEETIGMLDYADISSVDVAIRPYVWTVNDKTGIKAYLKTLYVTLNEDEFQEKYLVDGDFEYDEDPPK